MAATSAKLKNAACRLEKLCQVQHLRVYEYQTDRIRD